MFKLPCSFFFEQTTLDECASIDIAEKKIMPFGGHNQEKKKKTQKQHRQVGLGHQQTPSTPQLNITHASRIGTSTQAKQLKPVGLGHQRGNAATLELYSNEATPLHSKTAIKSKQYRSTHPYSTLL